MILRGCLMTQGGREYLSLLFYSTYFLMATGWSELSITVSSKHPNHIYSCVHDPLAPPGYDTIPVKWQAWWQSRC